MADFDLEALLAPLQDDAPCGADLEYDPAFMALEAAGAGKPEQQYGDTVIPAEEPDWPTVQELALALARRTRDLRVAVWLVRCGARLQGWPGALHGLQMVQGLLERNWDHVHPVEVALGRAEPLAGEAAPTEQGVLDAAAAAAGGAPGFAERLQGGTQAVQAIAAAIERQVGGAQVGERD